MVEPKKIYKTTTIELDEELWKEVKIKCIELDITNKTALNKALAMWLKRTKLRTDQGV